MCIVWVNINDDMFVYGVKGHYGNSSEAESDGDDDPETMLMVS